MTAVDPRAHTLDALARLVREEADAYVREVTGPGFDAAAELALDEGQPAQVRAVAVMVASRVVRLAGWCGIASAALIAAYRAHGIEAVLALLDTLEAR